MSEEHDNDESSLTNPGLMYIVCAKCKTWIDVKPGRVNLISHGLCGACYAEAEKELDAAERDAATSATSVTRDQ